jgi:hypothetical protein
MLSQQLRVSTHGEKRILIELLPEYHVDSGLTIRSIRVTSTAAPSMMLSFSCHVVDSDMNEFPQPVAYVDAASWMQPQVLILQPLPSGNYTIAATFLSNSSGDFALGFLSENTFEITSPVASVPSLRASAFTSDGLSVKFVFHGVVDYAGSESSILHSPFPSYFDCASILDFGGVSEHICYWENALTIVLGVAKRSEHLALGSNATILGDRLRSACRSNASECATWPTFPQTVTILGPPAEPVIPRVVISAPSFIGSCGNFSLDLGLSTGSAGHNWASITFHVYNSSGQFAAGVLDEYVGATGGWLRSLVVPSAVFEPGWYTIYAEMCNVFGACGHNFHPLHVSPRALPSVEILGAKVLRISTHSPVSLQAVPQLTQCGGEEDGASDSTSVIFAWCVNKNYTIFRGVASSAVQPGNFKLPPYSLDPGATYNIDVMVTVAGVSSYDTVVVMVEPSKLVVTISGPERRTLRQGERYLLDASNSFVDDANHLDPHISRNMSDSFSYTWECRILKPHYDSSCAGFVEDFAGSWAGKPSVEMFLNDSVSMDEDYELEVGVRVSDGNVAGYATAWLVFVRNTAPSISLSSVRVVNPSASLIVYGTVDLETHFPGGLLVNVSYSIAHIADDLASLALSRTSRRLSVGKRHNMHLVLKSGVLPARGAPYMVTLSSAPSGASATTSVRVNQPPVSGDFSISPTTGVAFQTQYHFLATLWEDMNDDLPLSYEFGFISAAGARTTVRRERVLNSVATTLPRGHGGLSFRDLTCFALIFDSLGAYTQRNFTATVALAVHVSLSSIALNAQKENLDTSSALLISMMMNEVDCSQSPNCSALRRNQCSTINQTCGECLSDAIGDLGHHNSACISPGEYRRMSAQQGCVTDDDCSQWDFCSVESLCQRRLKQCRSRCSRRGNCSFVNINSGAAVSSCFLGDASCSAECSCSREYAGFDCSDLLVDADLKQNATLRLLEVFGKNMDTDEPDVNFFTYWISILEAMLHSPHIISRKSFMRALDILFNTFDKVVNLELHATEDDLKRVGRILDIMLQSVLLRQVTAPAGSAICPDEALLTFSDLFKTFQLLILDRLVEGQDVLSLWAETFRSSTQLSSGGWLSLAVPSTLFSDVSEEKEAGSSDPPSLSTNESNALAVFSFKARIYGACANAFIANPVHVVLDHRSRTGGEDSAIATKLSIPNNVQQDFPLPEIDTSFSTECVTGDFGSYNYTCYVSPSQNYTVTHTCRGFTSEQLTTTCPTVYIEPSCHIVDGSDSLFSCSVASFTLQDTRCSCSTSVANTKQGSPSTTVRQTRQVIEDTYDLRVVTVLKVVVEESSVQVASIRYIPTDEASYMSVQSLAVCFLLASTYLLYSVRHDRRGSDEKATYLIKKVGCEDDWTDGISFDDNLNDREDEDEGGKKSRGRKMAGRALSQYFLSLLPPLFKTSVSIWDRFYLELWQHHRYLAGARKPETVTVRHGCDTVSSSASTIWTLKHLVVQSVALLFLTALCHYQVSHAAM